MDNPERPHIRLSDETLVMMAKNYAEASKKAQEEMWKHNCEISKINEEQVWRQYEAYPGKCFQLERESGYAGEGEPYHLHIAEVLSVKKGNGGKRLYVKYLHTSVQNWSCVNPGPLSVEVVTEDAGTFPRNYIKEEISSKKYDKIMKSIRSKFKEFFRG